MRRARRRSTGLAVAVVLSAASALLSLAGCDSVFGIGTLPYPKDSGDRDGGKSDAPDAPTPCDPTLPYMPVPWAPPTPRSAACTTTQLSEYETCYPNCDNFRKDEANAECVFCIETDVSASEHGPVVTQTKNGQVTPVLVNVGGCQALADGMTSSGSCGDQENRAQGCLATECGTCSDFSDPGPGGPAATCESQAQTGACDAYTTNSSCDAELAAGGPAADCLTLSMFLGSWCTVPDGGLPSCDTNTTFDAPPWAPPTPFGQDACTQDQIDAYESCFPNCATFEGDPTNANCLRCIETDENASEYGPVVTSNGSITFVNFGGCVDDAEGSQECGQALNAFNACAEAECGMCADFSMPQPNGPAEQCEAAELLNGHCMQYNDEAMNCFADVGDGGSAAACDNLGTFLPVWCGPTMVDGGPPVDSGMDSGMPPMDSGMPPMDTGTGPMDTGSGPMDTGGGPVDTGAGPFDTGSTLIDSPSGGGG